MAKNKTEKAINLLKEMNLQEATEFYKEAGKILSEFISTRIGEIRNEKDKLEEIQQTIQNS